MQQKIVALADTGFVATAMAAILGALPTLALVLTVLYGIGRLYVMWQEIQINRKKLKETDAPPDQR